MDLVTLLGTYALLSGAHTMGHVSEGSRQGVDVSIDPTNYREIWKKDKTDKSARIHNAGFEMQEQMKRAVGKEANFASALYKLAYLYGEYSPKFVPIKGDTDFIGDVKGKDAKKVAQLSLLLSSLADLHKYLNPDRKWDVGFWQSQTGTPGIQLGVRF